VVDGDPRAGDPARHALTVDGWARAWYPSRRGLRQSTSVRNLSLYVNHIKPVFGHLLLEDVKAAQVQVFVDDLVRKPVSQPSRGGAARTLASTTVREIYQELDKCLTAARHAGHLRHDPCRDIGLPKVERQDMQLLTRDEVEALAQSIDDRYAALIYVLAYGGLRIGEAAALLPSDFDGRTVTVTKSTGEVQGKLVTVEAAQTDASRRLLPLPGFVAAHVVQHVQTFPGAYLFTGRDGGQVRSNVFRARQFARARAAIDRPELRIQDLRHTAVSFWIAEGFDLPRIRKLAGHNSTAFLLNRYGHLLTGENEAALPRAQGRE
jgi:integrase